MGFPAGTQTVVLSGHVALADGAAQRDTITITPSPARVVSTTYNYIVENDPIAVVPDRSTGTWSVRLLATDASTFNPSGWTYSVTIGDDAPFSVSLPAASPAVDLADLTPVSSDPGTYDLLVPLSSLGNSATRNVGTVAGTVAAGDDSRLTDSRTPSGGAGGDLSGTYPNPAVAKVKGVAVSATPPSSGQVLTASSSSAASWQAPSGGGGGGGITTPADDRIDLEIVVLTNTASWTIVRTSGGVAIGKSVAASVGDRVWVSPSFMYTGTQYNLDLAVMKGDGSISRYASSSGAGTTPGPEGYGPMYTQASSFPHVSGIAQFIVGADEIDGDGMFTVNLAYIAPSLSGTANKIYGGDGYLLRWFMANIDRAPS